MSNYQNAKNCQNIFVQKSKLVNASCASKTDKAKSSMAASNGRLEPLGLASGAFKETITNAVDIHFELDSFIFHSEMRII